MEALNPDSEERKGQRYASEEEEAVIQSHRPKRQRVQLKTTYH